MIVSSNMSWIDQYIYKLIFKCVKIITIVYIKNTSLTNLRQINLNNEFLTYIKNWEQRQINLLMSGYFDNINNYEHNIPEIIWLKNCILSCLKMIKNLFSINLKNI